MSDIPIRKKPGSASQGFSDQLANQINRQQAIKYHRKMGAKKMHPPKVGQGYTQHRPGVDKL
jgi:hypothetical protein